MRKLILVAACTLAVPALAQTLEIAAAKGERITISMAQCVVDTYRIEGMFQARSTKGGKSKLGCWLPSEGDRIMIGWVESDGSMTIRAYDKAAFQPKVTGK